MLRIAGISGQSMLSGIARDTALMALFALVLWAPLGSRILRRLKRDSAAAPLSASIAAGMGAWGLLLLALGLAGLLYRSVMVAALLALFAVLRLDRHLIPAPGLPGGRATAMERACLGLLGLVAAYYVVLSYLSALAPETAFDSLNVHLPYARQAAVSHRAGFEPNNWSSVMPALPLMAYITAFLFSGLTLAKLFNFLCYVLGGGVVYDFARHRWGRPRAMAAALLFWSSPVALFEATTALIDLPLALFSGISVFALLEWSRSGDRASLHISAGALGLALGCKYHAVFLALPILILVAWNGVRNLRWDWRRAVQAVALYAGIVSILFLPWLLRAWLYSGNPVFPLANGIFQSPYFPPAMMEAAKAAYANEGIGTSMRSLALLPWKVTFQPGAFRGTLGYIFLPGIALALARYRSREVRFGLFIVGAYFMAWAFTAQEIRYLLPLLPLLSLVTAAGFLGVPDSMRDFPGPARRYAWKEAIGFAAVASGALLAVPEWYPKLVPQWTYWHSYQSPVPYLTGRQSSQDFLRRDVPSIYVYEFLNERLTQRDRVMLLNDASQFYSRVPTLYSFTVEAERILHAASEAEVVGRMRESGITHVLLNYNGIAPIPGVAPRRGVYFFLDPGFQNRFLLETHSYNNVTLFRVLYPD